jgi:hypothetical protein
MNWQKTGKHISGYITDRFAHAGLSSDGRYCFIADFDDQTYGVWSIYDQEVLWSEVRVDLDEPTYPALDHWIANGFIEIQSGPAKGSYRVFGCEENHPLLENSRYGLRITSVATAEKDDYAGSLVLIETTSSQPAQRLEFDDASGDFAFASFSEDGSMLAVLTAYDITFFAPQETNA